MPDTPLFSLIVRKGTAYTVTFRSFDGVWLQHESESISRTSDKDGTYDLEVRTVSTTTNYQRFTATTTVTPAANTP
jgi:hypothetical protein